MSKKKRKQDQEPNVIGFESRSDTRLGEPRSGGPLGEKANGSNLSAWRGLNGLV